jgi:hypothetical protein
MSDVLDGGAPAPVDSIAAPEATVETPVSPPNPVHSEPVAETKPEAPAKPVSIDDALDKATKKVEAEAKGEKPVEKAETKPVKAEEKTEPAPKPRDETGKFAKSDEEVRAQATKAATDAAEAVKRQSEASPHKDAPARFDDAAKAEWEKAPEAVKGAIHRTIRELEQGHQKYKADSERFDKVREYDDLARQNGREGVHESLKQVVELEQAFQRNPIEGFQKVADHFGLSLRAVAAHIMGQTPDQVQSHQDSTISSLKQQLSGIAPVVQEYQSSQNEKTISEWAADKPHFAQLRPEIVEYVKQGIQPEDAYQRAVNDFQEKARAFGFAPAASTNGAHTATDTALAQTQAVTPNPAGQKSIHGAPSSGSDPAKRKPSKSLDESLDRAFAMHG